jgi:hypothetical protein
MAGLFRVVAMARARKLRPTRVCPFSSISAGLACLFFLDACTPRERRGGGGQAEAGAEAQVERRLLAVRRGQKMKPGRISVFPRHLRR